MLFLLICRPGAITDFVHRWPLHARRLNAPEKWCLRRNNDEGKNREKTEKKPRGQSMHMQIPKSFGDKRYPVSLAVVHDDAETVSFVATRRNLAAHWPATAHGCPSAARAHSITSLGSGLTKSAGIRQGSQLFSS